MLFPKNREDRRHIPRREVLREPAPSLHILPLHFPGFSCCLSPLHPLTRCTCDSDRTDRSSLTVKGGHTPEAGRLSTARAAVTEWQGGAHRAPPVRPSVNLQPAGPGRARHTRRQEQSVARPDGQQPPLLILCFLPWNFLDFH